MPPNLHQPVTPRNKIRLALHFRLALITSGDGIPQSRIDHGRKQDHAPTTGSIDREYSESSGKDVSSYSYLLTPKHLLHLSSSIPTLHQWGDCHTPQVHAPCFAQQPVEFVHDYEIF